MIICQWFWFDLSYCGTAPIFQKLPRSKYGAFYWTFKWKMSMWTNRERKGWIEAWVPYKTIHVQARHVRCTSGHVPFDPRFCFVPVDVHPVYETDGAPTQPWDVLFSISSSFVECDDMWCTTTTTLWNKHTKDILFPQSSTFQCYGCKDLNWWNLLSSSSIGVRQQTRGASTHLCCLQCTLWTYCPLTPPGPGAHVENQKDSQSWRLLVSRPYFSKNSTVSMCTKDILVKSETNYLPLEKRSYCSLNTSSSSPISYLHSCLLVGFQLLIFK